MKYTILLISLLFFNSNLCAQNQDIGNTRFVAGLSGPELLHVGVTYRLANSSQLGVSAGVGPSWGMIWSSINLEHRLYIGNNSERNNQKNWFVRQGTTFFPSATEKSQHFSLNLTLGKDFIFKNISNGITIDFGVFYLPDSEDSSILLIKSLNLWPALRFQFYFS